MSLLEQLREVAAKGALAPDLEKIELSRSRRMLSFRLVKGSFEIAIDDLDDARAFASAVAEALAHAR